MLANGNSQGRHTDIEPTIKIPYHITGLWLTFAYSDDNL